MLGRNPRHRATIPVLMLLPSLKLQRMPSSCSSIEAIPRPNKREIPLFSNRLWISSATSGRMAVGKMQGAISAMAVGTWCAVRASTTLMPTQEAPITSAEEIPSWMPSSKRSASSTVRITYTFFFGSPGMGGTKGWEPLARMISSKDASVPLSRITVLS